MSVPRLNGTPFIRAPVSDHRTGEPEYSFTRGTQNSEIER